MQAFTLLIIKISEILILTSDDNSPFQMGSIHNLLVMILFIIHFFR